MKKNIINICYKEWLVGGISLDVDIISSLLESSGFIVYFNGHPIRFKGISKIKKVIPKLSKFGFMALSYLGMKKFSVNIHLEIIEESDINLADKNIMIPNLEWLRDDSCRLLSCIDLFFCKTKSAKKYFTTKGLPAIHTSFSTISPHDKQYKQVKNSFIHIAGSSVVKGTEMLAKIWSGHPEWPKLTILARPIEHIKQYERENLEIIGGFLEREKLRRFQNESEIHICPSEAEGFGHYICEPMSCGAIVITVDGEPMNELVQPDRGVLIRVAQEVPMYHATKFLFDPVDFERKIEMVFSMTETEKKQMKSNAKKWFVDNEYFFQKSFISAINDCISNKI